MATEIFHVDAFASCPFTGNPAGVCLLEQGVESDWMQKVAMEMSLSETAFLWPHHDDGYSLRWFTPEVEVDLCGHATLAAAHVLWEQGRLDTNVEARFHTQSGVLTAKRNGHDRIVMDFPSRPATVVETPMVLAKALGGVPVCAAEAERDFLVELESEEEVRKLKPDFKDLRELNKLGVIVTSVAEGKDYDFVSRFFAPNAGIDEDPVTGSAHCTLAPYWCDKLGRAELMGYQASKRGGYVHVKLRGDRVCLGGQALTVMTSTLR